MGGDISRFIERGEQSRQLTVGAQRAMKKKEKKKKTGGRRGDQRKKVERTPLHTTRDFQSIFRWAVEAHAQRRKIITLKS